MGGNKKHPHQGGRETKKKPPPPPPIGEENGLTSVFELFMPVDRL